MKKRTGTRRASVIDERNKSTGSSPARFGSGVGGSGRGGGSGAFLSRSMNCSESSTPPWPSATVWCNLTIIAPRHPERGREIYAATARAGLRASQRSLGLQPDRATDIYIADTIGEMGLFYRVAPIVFLGGSLVPHGGQNPIEPAKLGAALIHGPHIHNFTEVYAALEHAGGAYQVNGADDLAATLDHLIYDQATREDVAQRGTKAVMALGGALRKTMMEIAPYLLKMHLGNRP